MSEKAGKRHQHTKEWVRISEMRIDHQYQRPLDKKWAQEIADNFDPDMMSVLVVSRRDDGFCYVLDGQQRKGALELLGWHDQKVECLVYTGLRHREEALLFDWLNRRKPVKTFYRFRARLMWGEKFAVAVTAIINECGFEIGVMPKAGVLTAVSACEKVYRGHRSHRDVVQPLALRRALEVLRETWSGNPDALRGEIILGYGHLFIRDGAAVSLTTLVKKMATFSGGPAGLLGAARGLRAIRGSAVADCVSEILVEQYNKGRKIDKLEPWR